MKAPKQQKQQRQHQINNKWIVIDTLISFPIIMILLSVPHNIIVITLNYTIKCIRKI